MKTTGIILIIFSGTGLGLCKSMELSGRLKILERLAQLLLLLKGEIRCTGASLEDAFLDVAKKMPGANLYVLLCLVNHLSKEDMLSKMAELLETLISWSLKTMLGAVLGLQAVRGLVAPAMDAIKRTAIGKTAGAIPAVGNAVNVVTELILTGALLVKNCLGAVAVVALLLAGAGPVIHYGVLSLSYRFLAAAAQPVSDKRIVGCLGTMGEGCAMLLRIMITAEVMCILTFVILMASVGG